MIKLLIVDDEPLALDNFAELVEWERYGYELVGTETDGKAALETVKSKMPDIVFTDIRMPVMDGLELCRHLHEEFPEIRLVLLTAFRDFEYAHKAIS